MPAFEIYFFLLITAITTFSMVLMGVAASKFGNTKLRSVVLVVMPQSVLLYFLLFAGVGVSSHTGHFGFAAAGIEWMVVILLQRTLTEHFPHLSFIVVEESNSTIDVFDYAMTHGWHPATPVLNLVIKKHTYVAGMFVDNRRFDAKVFILNEGILGGTRPPRDGFMLD